MRFYVSMSDSKNTVMVELTPEQLHLVIETCTDSFNRGFRVCATIADLTQRVSRDEQNYSDLESSLLIDALNSYSASVSKNSQSIQTIVEIFKKQFESFEKDNVSTFMTPLPLENKKVTASDVIKNSMAATKTILPI